jgi:hypothetical protein
MGLRSSVAPGSLSFSSFLTLYIFGKSPCTGDQPVARPLPIHRATPKQTRHTDLPALGENSRPQCFSRRRQFVLCDGHAAMYRRKWHYEQHRESAHFLRSLGRVAATALTRRVVWGRKEPNFIIPPKPSTEARTYEAAFSPAN